MFTNRKGIRESNERAVLSVIANDGPISRINLSGTIGLNKATVSNITKRLLEQKLISEVGIGESTIQGGRRPIMLQLNKEAGFSICVDIGYNYIDVMITYLDGSTWKRKLSPFLEIKREKITSDLIFIINQLIKDLPESPFGIIGMTIAIHGVVMNNQISFTPAYDFAKLPLAENLMKHFSFPIYIENEANLLAIAEHAKDSTNRNLVSVSIHSGIGSGIIINDILYTGEEGYAGKIGHMVVEVDGKLCTCGSRGCLECYCSEKVLLDEYREQSGHKEAIIPDICKLYLQGDILAVSLVSKMIKYLAVGIQNIVTMYNPKVIVINSEISRLIPDFTQKVKTSLSSFIGKDIQIKQSVLGEEAILYGCAVITISRFLEIPYFNLK